MQCLSSSSSDWRLASCNVVSISNGIVVSIHGSTLIIWQQFLEVVSVIKLHEGEEDRKYEKMEFETFEFETFRFFVIVACSSKHDGSMFRIELKFNSLDWSLISEIKKEVVAIGKLVCSLTLSGYLSPTDTAADIKSLSVENDGRNVVVRDNQLGIACHFPSSATTDKATDARFFKEVEGDRYCLIIAYECGKIAGWYAGELLFRTTVSGGSSAASSFFYYVLPVYCAAVGKVHLSFAVVSILGAFHLFEVRDVVAPIIFLVSFVFHF